MTATHLLLLAVAVLGAAAGRALDSLALHAPRGARLRHDGPADGAAAVLVEEAAPPRRWDRALGAPVPELAGAVLGVLVVARFGARPDLPAWLWFAALALLIAIVDLREHLVLNRVLLPGTAVAVVLLAGAALTTGDGAALGRACLAGLVAFGCLLVMALVAPSGLGMGDVKLAGLLGLYLGWLGWHTVLPGFLIAFVLQALLGLALLVLRRVGRRGELPFGPALLAGTLAAALTGQPLS